MASGVECLVEARKVRLKMKKVISLILVFVLITLASMSAYAEITIPGESNTKQSIVVVDGQAMLITSIAEGSTIEVNGLNNYRVSNNNNVISLNGSAILEYGQEVQRRAMWVKKSTPVPFYGPANYNQYLGQRTYNFQLFQDIYFISSHALTLILAVALPPASALAGALALLAIDTAVYTGFHTQTMYMIEDVYAFDYMPNFERKLVQRWYLDSAYTRLVDNLTIYESWT